ncbi:MAG: hopanoid biosynthesis-associated protein HpnK [Limisphaerales bacterium]
MKGKTAARRLIVNADDFGRSSSINEAVVRAHRDGILTSASLMVNETAAGEAVRLARENPRLGVGLHLTLVRGRAALPPERIAHLAGVDGRFSENAAAAGWRYFFQAKCRSELKAEMEEHFAKFHATGLKLDHVNGHLNIHLHPVIFQILMENSERWKIQGMRLTRDSFLASARLAAGEWGYRISHAVIFGLLSNWARPRLERQGVRHTAWVFGLLQNGRVDAKYMEKLLRRLPSGDLELYSHPSLDQFKNEFDALVDPAIRKLARAQAIQLIRYQDL